MFLKRDQSLEKEFLESLWNKLLLIHEQWKKNELFSCLVYFSEILLYYTQLCGDYFISHEMRIPSLNNQQFNGKYRGPWCRKSLQPQVPRQQRVLALTGSSEKHMCCGERRGYFPGMVKPTVSNPEIRKFGNPDNRVYKPLLLGWWPSPMTRTMGIWTRSNTHIEPSNFNQKKDRRGLVDYRKSDLKNGSSFHPPSPIHLDLLVFVGFQQKSWRPFDNVQSPGKIHQLDTPKTSNPVA